MPLFKHYRQFEAMTEEEVNAGKRAVAAERRAKRSAARELFDDLPLQVRLADAYRRAEELVPGDRVLHVSGEGEAEAVTAAIARALAAIAGD